MSEPAWDEAKCIQLIEKFKTNPVLWNTKHPQFYKQQKKNEAWDAIANDFNISWWNCKRKMGILLSSFRREKSKMIRQLSAGATSFQSTWFAFDHLSFLMDKGSFIDKKITSDSSIDQNGTVSTQSPATNDETIEFSIEDNKSEHLKSEPLSDQDDDIGFEELDPVTHPYNSMKSDPMMHSPLSTLSRRIRDSGPGTNTPETSESYRCDEPKQINVTRSHVDSNKLEEIAAFTNLVQSKMKKYPHQILITVQKEISDILFKADQTYYKNIDDQQNNSSKRRKISEM